MALSHWLECTPGCTRGYARPGPRTPIPPVFRAFGIYGSHRGGKWRGWATWSDSTLPAGFCRGVSFCGRPVWIERAWPCAGPGVDWVVGLCRFWSFILAAPCRRGAGRDAPALWTSGISLPGVWSSGVSVCRRGLRAGFGIVLLCHWGIRPGLPQVGSEVGLRGLGPGLPQVGAGGGFQVSRPGFRGIRPGFSTVWGCGQTNPLVPGRRRIPPLFPPSPGGMGAFLWKKSFFPYIYRKLNVCIPPN